MAHYETLCLHVYALYLSAFHEKPGSQWPEVSGGHAEDGEGGEPTDATVELDGDDMEGSGEEGDLEGSDSEAAQWADQEQWFGMQWPPATTPQTWLQGILFHGSSLRAALHNAVQKGGTVVCQWVRPRRVVPSHAPRGFHGECSSTCGGESGYELFLSCSLYFGQISQLPS